MCDQFKTFTGRVLVYQNKDDEHEQKSLKRVINRLIDLGNFAQEEKAKEEIHEYIAKSFTTEEDLGPFKLMFKNKNETKFSGIGIQTHNFVKKYIYREVTVKHSGKQGGKLGFSLNYDKDPPTVKLVTKADLFTENNLSTADPADQILSVSDGSETVYGSTQIQQFLKTNTNPLTFKVRRTFEEEPESHDLIHV